MRSIALLGLLLLTACVNVTTTQDRCLETNQAFTAQVDCLKAGVAENRGMRNTDAMRDYVQTAEQLAQQTRDRTLSDEDARTGLRAKLQQIKEDDIRQRAAELEERNRLDRSFTTFTDCSRDAGSMACVTY